MGLFDFFSKTKKAHSEHNHDYSVSNEKIKYEYPIADFQKDFVVEEIKKMNSLLKTIKYTSSLHMDSDALTPDSYFRFDPFTPKTGKISKYPCMLHISSTVYMGYNITLYYDINDNIGKGTINIATSKYNYDISIKTVDSNLKIMKVVTTDDNLNNEKLYHVMSNGEIFAK